MREEIESADAAGEKRLVDRMIFFTDAVFAFAMTLLVLDLRPPAAADANWSAAAEGHFATFVLSFGVNAVFWAGHLSATRRLIVFDWTVLWLNVLLMFAIVLTPFSASLLGSPMPEAESWRIYCATMAFASLTQSALSLALFRDRGRLVGGAGIRERISRLLRAMSPGLAFGAGVALIEAGRLDLSRWCWLLVFPVLALAAAVGRGADRPRPAKGRAK